MFLDTNIDDIDNLSQKKDTSNILTLTCNSNPYILCCSCVSITVCRDWNYMLVSKYPAQYVRIGITR